MKNLLCTLLLSLLSLSSCSLNNEQFSENSSKLVKSEEVVDNSDEKSDSVDNQDKLSEEIIFKVCDTNNVSLCPLDLSGDEPRPSYYCNTVHKACEHSVVFANRIPAYDNPAKLFADAIKSYKFTDCSSSSLNVDLYLLDGDASILNTNRNIDKQLYVDYRNEHIKDVYDVLREKLVEFSKGKKSDYDFICGKMDEFMETNFYVVEPFIDKSEIERYKKRLLEKR